MTLTTTTRARRSTTSSAPRVNLRKSLFMGDNRHEVRSISKSTWVGSLVVQR